MLPQWRHQHILLLRGHLTLWRTPRSATKKMIKQATRQLQAAQGKHIVWLFADKDAAKDVRKKFDENENNDLKSIQIRIFPSMETII